MKEFKPVDIIMLLIAVTLMVTLGSATIKAIMSESGLPDAKWEWASNIYTSLVSIVSIYIGYKLNLKSKDKE